MTAIKPCTLPLLHNRERRRILNVIMLLKKTGDQTSTWCLDVQGDMKIIYCDYKMTLNYTFIYIYIYLVYMQRVQRWGYCVNMRYMSKKSIIFLRALIVTPITLVFVVFPFPFSLHLPSSPDITRGPRVNLLWEQWSFIKSAETCIIN